MTFGIGNQVRYTSVADIGYPGLVRQLVLSDTYVNAADTAQSWLVAIGTAASNTAYVLSFPSLGRTITVTTGPTATPTEARDLLLNAIRTDGIVSGRFTSAIVDAGSFRLTQRFFGVSDAVTASGGGAGFAATETPAGAVSLIPYGRVVATKPTYPLTDGLPGAALPNAAGDTPLGITIGTHAISQTGLAPNGLSGYRRRIGVLRQGSIWAECEVPITPDIPLFYRHTANGGLNKLGVLAPAAGTGLAALPGATSISPSYTVADGIQIVSVDINNPA